MNSVAGPAQLEAKSGTKFLDLIGKELPPGLFIFRGQQNEAWELLPRAGRPPFDRPERRQRRSDPEFFSSSLPPDDIMWFKEWRNNAIAFSKSIADLGEFECLAYAQHYGLATRLLDWTLNPLVALFFAVEPQPSRDTANGAVFAYSHIVYVEEELGIEKQVEKYPQEVVRFGLPADVPSTAGSAATMADPEEP